MSKSETRDSSLGCELASGSSREQQVASQAASTGARDRQRTRAKLLKAATLGLGSCMMFVNR